MNIQHEPPNILSACPVCTAAIHHVEELERISQLAYSPPFHDAAGVLHDHDSNKQTSVYQCSNGHRWLRTWYPQCSVEGCGWVHAKEQITVLPDEAEEDGA